MSSKKIEIDEDKCKGCGNCVVVCPNDNIGMREVTNSEGYLPAYDKGIKCIRCGNCFQVCSDAAIKVKIK